jgi:hypothetical protein
MGVYCPTTAHIQKYRKSINLCSFLRELLRHKGPPVMAPKSYDGISEVWRKEEKVEGPNSYRERNATDTRPTPPPRSGGAFRKLIITETNKYTYTKINYEPMGSDGYKAVQVSQLICYWNNNKYLRGKPVLPQYFLMMNFLVSPRGTIINRHFVLSRLRFKHFI